MAARPPPTRTPGGARGPAAAPSRARRAASAGDRPGATPGATPDPLELIRRMSRHRRGHFVATSLLWTLVHALPVAWGLALKLLFDALAGDASAAASPWSLLAFVVSVDLVRIGILAGGTWTWSGYWLQITLLLRRNMLAHLLAAPGPRRLPGSPSEAVTRFRDDVEDLGQWVEMWVDVWGLLVFAAVALVVMATVSPGLTAWMLLPLLVSLVATQALRPTIKRARRRSRAATEAVTDFIGEIFGAVQAVEIAGKRPAVLERFRGLNATRRRAAVVDSALAEGFRSLNDNMVNVAIGLVLLVVAGSLGDGFGVGDFALFLAYLPRLTGTMSFLGAMMVQHKRAGVAFERTQRLLVDAAPDAVLGSVDLGLDRDGASFAPERPAVSALDRLELRGLHTRFADGAPGLRGIDLDVRRGEFVVVTGPVGAGKSTLLRALLGLVPLEAGEIRWNGRPIDDPSTFFVPPRSAYTAQVPRLFSDTLRENVTQGERSAGRLERALDLSVLARDVARLDAGLDTPVGTRGVKLSGGQVQRAAAARAFLPEAELLVIDDLSSALDVDTERRLWDGIFADRRATVVAVSNRRAALRRADRIVLLDGGRVIARGRLDDLLATEPAMRAMWGDASASVSRPLPSEAVAGL